MHQRSLAAFHAVARAGGFTAAAKLLNVGQPTVSTHVRALEDQFKVELFHRRGRTVELTEIGQLLMTITRGMSMSGMLSPPCEPVSTLPRWSGRV